MTPFAFLLRVVISLIVFGGFVLALALLQHFLERPR